MMKLRLNKSYPKLVIFDYYLQAMPLHKKEIRTYALDRIHQVKLTDKHFELPEDFNLITYFYNSYGILVEPEEYDVETIRIKAINGIGHKPDYLRLLPLHPNSQKELERHKDYSIFEVKVYPSLDFIQEILSHGDEMEILSPQWVREEVAAYARNMYQMYKKDIDILDARDSLKKE